MVHLKCDQNLFHHDTRKKSRNMIKSWSKHRSLVMIMLYSMYVQKRRNRKTEDSRGRISAHLPYSNCVHCHLSEKIGLQSTQRLQLVCEDLETQMFETCTKEKKKQSHDAWSNLKPSIMLLDTWEKNSKVRNQADVLQQIEIPQTENSSL